MTFGAVSRLFQQLAAGSFFNIENLGPRVRSVFNGFAGKDGELLWSTRVYEIPNSKHQITNKSQIPILNDPNGIRTLIYWLLKFIYMFWILVIVICLLFEICYLEFLVTPADCRKRGKSIEAPSRGCLLLAASCHLSSCCTYIWAVHIIMCRRDECLISQHYLWGRGCYSKGATILDTVQTYLEGRNLTAFYLLIINSLY